MVWEALGMLQYSNPIAVFCSSPFVVFIIQLCSAIVSITFLLLQKLTNAPEPSMEDKNLRGVAQWCVLNNTTDNAWGFGQSCAMILLLLPIYAAVGEYLGQYEASGVIVGFDLTNTRSGIYVRTSSSISSRW